jgi:hypothetical protein
LSIFIFIFSRLFAGQNSAAFVFGWHNFALMDFSQNGSVALAPTLLCGFSIRILFDG